MCFDGTSHYASFPPRCWWEIRDFVSRAFSFCWCAGSLQGLWYDWASCAFQVTSSSVKQCLVVQVSTINHLSPARDATPVLLCPTLALVTLAIGSACRQLVTNCPSTQLMTHEVRELSRNLVWYGLSLTRHWCNTSCMASSFSRGVRSDVHPTSPSSRKVMSHP